MKLTTWLSRAFPLGGAVRTASPPAAFLAAGLLLIAIHLIKTWRTAPTGSGS